MPAWVIHTSFHVLIPSVLTPSPKLIQFVHSCLLVHKITFILAFPHASQTPPKRTPINKAQRLT